jgi:integrase
VGRNKRRHRHLPPRLRLAHGAYFYADARGGRKPWVLIGRTYAEAIVRYGQMEAQHARSFDALCDRYVREALPSKAESTQRVYAALLKPLRRVFGTLDPETITQPMAYRYLDERGPGTMGRQEVAVLASVLAFGVSKGWVTRPHLHGMRFPAQKRRKRYLTDAEVQATLAAASPEVAHAIRFLAFTALRVSDAIGVRWRDWRADGLHVRVSKTASELCFERTPAMESLMTAMRERRVGSLYVLADAQGRAWTYRRLHAAWSKIAPADANLHDLRRKRLTDLAQAHGVEVAQQIAAHSDPRMTQTYLSGERRVRL